MARIKRGCGCREEFVEVDDDAWVATGYICMKCLQTIWVERVGEKDEGKDK